MSSGALYDTDAPTIEVRTYRNEPHRGSRDIPTPDELAMSEDEDCCIGSATIPARGTE